VIWEQYQRRSINLVLIDLAKRFLSKMFDQPGHWPHLPAMLQIFYGSAQKGWLVLDGKFAKFDFSLPFLDEFPSNGFPVSLCASIH
jgi:hypothetical protein